MNRPTVHHLGRVGDVPGGMTQVLNGYLAWRFDRVDVDVITSRGDPHDGIASLRLAVRAAIRVLHLPRERTVLVGHLSERGSFLREGALLRLAALRGVPTVAHLHGASFAAFAARFPGLVRFALGAADRVVSLSGESSAVAGRFVPEDRIHLVPNALQPGPAGTKERLVVFGGAVGRRKGVDVLLDAWERLPRRSGWRLVLAGPVVDRHVVREVDGVELAGPLPHDAMMALLDRAAVAVLPSRQEAMPVFLLEAMARHACPVATSVGGVPALLDEGCGFLVEPGDVTGLAAALDAAIGSEQERMRRAGAAHRRFLDRYAAAAVLPRLESVWLAALPETARVAA